MPTATSEIQDASETVKADRVWKCRIEDRFLRPCTTLDECVDMYMSSERGKGFALLSLSNMTIGKIVANRPIIKLGPYRKNGIIMNYCPFCGEQTFPDRDKYVSDVAEARGAA